MKTVIFDLDGVIVSTDEYHYRAWKKIADEIGARFNREINHRLRGVSRMESLDIILEKYSPELSDMEKEMLAESKNNHYRSFLNSMSEKALDAEVKETMDMLRKRGYVLTIGSSSKNAAFILSKLGLSHYFDAVSDGNNISNSKPDPEVFIKAAGFVGAKAEDCFVVEDACAGIEAAKAAGMTAIAIGEACGEKADYCISSFSELLEILP